MGVKTQVQKQTGIPYIDSVDEINPSLLSMAGTITVPSDEVIESDPRLASAFGL